MREEKKGLPCYWSQHSNMEQQVFFFKIVFHCHVLQKISKRQASPEITSFRIHLFVSNVYWNRLKLGIIYYCIGRRQCELYSTNPWRISSKVVHNYFNTSSKLSLTSSVDDEIPAFSQESLVIQVFMKPLVSSSKEAQNILFW